MLEKGGRLGYNTGQETRLAPDDNRGSETMSKKIYETDAQTMADLTAGKETV